MIEPMHRAQFLRLLFSVPLSALLWQCRARPTTKVTLAGGSIAGGWSAISEGLVTCFRRELPGAAITYEPGRDGANAALVNSGRVELGLVHAAMARLALEGADPYQQRLHNIRGISLVYRDSAFHFLVNGKHGFSSIEQIKRDRYPLRLSASYRGSFMEMATKTALEAYGISYQDIESWGGKVYFRALRPSLELMKGGRLDALGVSVQFPESNIREASVHRNLRLLPLSSHAIAYVNERLETERSQIPAGTYTFLERDVPTFSGAAVLIAHSALEEELAYRLTGALLANLDYLRRVHRALSKLEPSDFPRVGKLPLHPGAQRFYREAGIL
jgi:TRAP transporter TAXI family solute receptor